MPEHLDALAARFDALGDFTTAGIETALREVAKAAGLKPATLIHGTRLAATGRSAGPGLFDILALLDRADAATRLRRAASAIGTRPGSAG
jgi:glutamyl/glutaminyl-tRNA synthetase